MNKKYNEQNLSQHFKHDLITKVRNSFLNGQSVNLISSQGIGTSLLFKYFLTHFSEKIIYVDCDHLAEPTLEEFYKHFLRAVDIDKDDVSKKEFMSLIRQKVHELLIEEEKIIIIFAHFDQLKKYFSKEFFDLMKYIRSQSSNRISFIINSYVPMSELLQNKLLTINTNLIGQTMYITPYNYQDIEEIAEKLLFLDTSDEWNKKAMELSGGSYYLLTLLSRTERIENLLSDPFIKIYFKRIMEGFTFKQRKKIEDVANGKVVNVDQYLLGLGIVQKNNDKYTLFTPLFEDYIRQNSKLKFSAGEKRMFQLLKQKLGKVVSKDELFNYVWGEDHEASDWAMNSMIYRIRTNTAFKEQGYEIENHKKLGYKLIKN